MTVIVYAGLIYYQLIVPYLGATISEKIISPLSRVLGKVFSYLLVQIGAGLVVAAALVTFIAIDSKGREKRISTLKLLIYYIKVLKFCNLLC